MLKMLKFIYRLFIFQQMLFAQSSILHKGGDVTIEPVRQSSKDVDMQKDVHVISV